MLCPVFCLHTSGGESKQPRNTRTWSNLRFRSAILASRIRRCFSPRSCFGISIHSPYSCAPTWEREQSVNLDDVLVVVVIDLENDGFDGGVAEGVNFSHWVV